MFKKVEMCNLELTNYCNLNCSFCPNQIMTRKKGHMDLALAKRILGEIKETRFTKSISTNVMGEPLLYPHFSEVLEFAKEERISLDVITNGELIDEAKGTLLLQSNLRIVRISFQAHDQKSFEYKRGRGEYSAYQEKIQNFIRKKFELNSKTSIYLFFITTSSRPTNNFRILHSPSEVRHFSNNWVGFANKLNQEFDLHYTVPEEVFAGHNMLLPGFYIDFQQSYHLWGGDICKNDFRITPRKAICRFPFTQLNILWNGDVTYCCGDYNGDLVFDNIQGKGVLEIFNSEKMQTIRKNFLTLEKIPYRCQRCQGEFVPKFPELETPEEIFSNDFSFRLKRASSMLKRILAEGGIFSFLAARIFSGTQLFKKWQLKRWERMNSSRKDG